MSLSLSRCEKTRPHRIPAVGQTNSIGMFYMDSKELAKFARRKLLEMVYRARAAHVASSLSVVDILAVLYAENLSDEFGDSSPPSVILSKGHAAAALYSVLAGVGVIPISWLEDYCADGAQLTGHVTAGVPGVDFSTGSLGHGLPFGLGVALARKLSSDNRRVFVVMSDGELNEGTTWESALQASQFSLSNLVVLIDRNGLQSLDSTENTLALEPIDKKWRSFGWDTYQVDGHNHEAMGEQLMKRRESQSPQVIICSTVKGKGVSFMEDSVLWHYRSPNESEFREAIRELSVE